MNVAIIPARGGSVRIPRKNIRAFHGKPIIAYSIEAAKASGLFSHVYVSTEDEEISEVAMEYGASLLPRPRSLADDERVGTQDVTAHGIRYLIGLGLVPDYACCIYATAPLMTAMDLRIGFNALTGNEIGWRYVYAEGWYYWGRSREFLERPEIDRLACLPLAHEYWIDINTEADWRRAEQMYRALENPIS